MLNSLFGDLSPRRLPTSTTRTAAPPLPAAMAGDTQTATRTATSAATTASSSIDVVVDDSPTEAIRAHFAAHRQDLQRASAMVTLLDPSGLWAAQVLRALAAAAGQPVQRLNLREPLSLRTLAVIERTLVPRRDAPALRVYHADIRGVGSTGAAAPDDITSALAEGSQLTAVIVGAMQPHALVALLRGLVAASHGPQWRCPQLVFILPPGAAALHQRILAQDWPSGVTVQALAEPLASAASVWNRVLEAWERTQGQQPTAPNQARTVLPAAAAGLQAAATTTTSTPTTTAARHPSSLHAREPSAPDSVLPLSLLNRLLLPMARTEGLLACGIVDLQTADLLASQQHGQPPLDLAALAEAMCAARLAHQAVAADEAPPDEILVTSGPRQTLLRGLSVALHHRARLGFVAVLDRQHANLALLRFKLLDAERLLG